MKKYIKLELTKEMFERIVNFPEDGEDTPLKTIYFSNVEQINTLIDSLVDVRNQALQPNLVANRIQTPDGTILWSRFAHDYVCYHDTVTNEDYMIDGGNQYRRTFVNEIKATDLSVYDTDPWEKQREVILRGTFDSKGNRVWVPISKLSNDHIKNLVIDSGMNMSTDYYREMCYREGQNIVVSEHNYDNEGVQSIIKN